MEMWLVFKGERLRLPVTPFFEIPYYNNNTEENLNEVGSINIAGNPGLRSASISSFFPAQRYDFLQSSDFVDDPYFYDRKIRDWARKKEPIRMIITETNHNFEVLIESYSSGETDGTGDVYFTIELKEYPRISKEEALDESEELKAENIDRFKDDKEALTEKLKTADKYDTRWTMAKKLTGNGENHPRLMAKNNIGPFEVISGKVVEL